MKSDIQLLRSDEARNLEFDWGSLAWFAMGALGNSSEITVGRCILQPGCHNPRHYHPNCTEVLVVIQGRIRHTIANEQEVELNEGDTVTIPPNIWHRATNIGEMDAVLYIAFTSADRLTVGE